MIIFFEKKSAEAYILIQDELFKLILNPKWK